MRKKILVVDDFASIRKFVCDTLEQKGYATIGAENGFEAFKLLSENTSTIDLVLTDYNMPDCTGFDLLKKIKSCSALKNVPVIFLTAELSPEKVKRAQDAGLAAWIKKPYRSQTFFAEIEKALSTKLTQ